MKLAPLIAVALLLCMALLAAVQARGKKIKQKRKFCVGKDRKRYRPGKGYLDTEACIRYRCILKRRKAKKGIKTKMVRKKMPLPCTVPGKFCKRSCTEDPDDNKHCVFNLVLSELSSDTSGRLGDGHKRPVLVYNGKLPGPTLTVCQGDDVTVNLQNNLNEHSTLRGNPNLPQGSTTLHFHGIREKQKSSSQVGWSKGGPWSDGVPLVAQCPIPSLESFTYHFLGSGSVDSDYNNAPAGTYWYHSHTGKQRMNGAAGKLIIMPREEHPDVDVDNPDNSLFLQEWYLSTGDGTPTSLLVNGKGKQHKNHHQCSQDFDSACISKYKGGETVQLTTVTNPHYASAIQPEYEVFQINEPLGKNYRFRIIGGIGDDVPIRISIEDHTFTAIATDSIDIDPVEHLDALWITAGERYDIVIHTKTSPKSGDAYKINVFHKMPDSKTICSIAWLQYPEQTVNTGYEADCNEMENEQFTKVLNPVPDNFAEWETPSKYVYPKDLRAKVQVNGIDTSLNTQFISLQSMDIADRTHMTFNKLSMTYPDIPFLYQSPSDSSNRCGVKCNQTGCDDVHLPSDCGTNFPPSHGCPCQHVIQQPWGSRNEWFEIILINSPESHTAHPIHHHGGWFNIVGMDQFENPITRDDIIALDQNGELNRNFDLPVFKDVVQVPKNGYVIFRAPIDNAGVWIVHCHINYHIEHGMAMVFQIGESDQWPMGPNKETADTNKNHDCF